MKPVPRMTWTPGPTGHPVPPTLDDLARYLPRKGKGPDGIRMEPGIPAEDGMPVLVCVWRVAHWPIGILAMRLLDGTPEIVNIAVKPSFQRIGVARKLCECALENGIDLRDVGSIWSGPLTPDGERLRDALVNDRARYGYASWEREGTAA